MKILYGVPSEGMGHATRSKVVVDYLFSQGHDVRIVTSDRAFTFLNKTFPGKVISIEGFHLAYKNAAVSASKTILLGLKSLPKQIGTNLNAYLEVIKQFSPQYIISDFESFTHFYATTNKLPLLSIDNMQVLNRCKLEIEIPKQEKLNYLLAKNIVKAKVPNARHYFISSFFQAPILKKNTHFVAPILRNEILNTKTSCENHIVVYQTSTSQKQLIGILNELANEQFYVYGFNKDEKYSNVQLKSFSEAGFINDFCSAKAVLSNGGYSFLSEALFLHKPVMSVPIKNQFEQFVNASYIQKLGYGRHFPDFSADGIKSFLYDLPHFNENLASFTHDNNQGLFQGLNKFLASQPK